MNKIRYILGLLTVVYLLCACEDNLEPKVMSPYGDEYAYTLPGPVEGFLTNAYGAIPSQIDHYGSDFLDAATGDAVTNQYGSSVYALGNGKMSSTSNPIGIWDAAYSSFQWIHLFQEKSADTATVKWWIANDENDVIERTRLIGESYFLRAYWGMELLKVYGGVTESGEVLGYPIVTKFVTEDQKDEFLHVTRNTYEECVQQILDDCDSAIALLPLEYSGDDLLLGKAYIGRASASAAYVLKSRVATFAASPAYNGNVDVQEKWERAALLSQEAIDKANLSYTALSYEAVTNPTPDKGSLTTPQDYLFRRYHNNNSLENRNLPPAFWGNGRTNPSQNLVDAFPMANGYPITDPASGYDPQNPFTGRDPRLDNTVIYNGASVEINGRGLEVAEVVAEYIVLDADTTEVDDGTGNMVEVVDIISDTVIYRAGLDSEAYDYRGTRTGYYLRKWISTKADMLTNVNQKLNSEHMFPIIRGAEAFFNLAEASNEVVGPSGIVPGCSLSAYDIMKDIRSKSIGLGATDPYLDSQLGSADDMRALIQNESRLEFAFENHRYFDLRRWMLPLDETVRGMIVNQDESGNLNYEGTDPTDPSGFVDIEERSFDSDRYYYHPLPYDEMVKNPNLENNKGW
ncbi:SusD family protein [Saccharicrinis fermentans DSM 9555 = JCM 21142]|uniref:SusD family protein n=2 Tax=Saccharicrinis fermentans TaxID=982 RepID=W7Y5B9_9BACT|nr:SusD family protein [Saccharicrinis fermentans DSM 9555 = JCM 21142]